MSNCGEAGRKKTASDGILPRWSKLRRVFPLFPSFFLYSAFFFTDYISIFRLPSVHHSHHIADSSAISSFGRQCDVGLLGCFFLSRWLRLCFPPHVVSVSFLRFHVSLSLQRHTWKNIAIKRLSSLVASFRRSARSDGHGQILFIAFFYLLLFDILKVVFVYCPIALQIIRPHRSILPPNHSPE